MNSSEYTLVGFDNLFASRVCLIKMNSDIINLKNDPPLEWIDQLYREHGKFIESVLRFAAADPNEMEDIYQEIFMALIKRNDLTSIRDMRDYLYILTMNKVNEYRHKKSRGKQLLKEYAALIADTPPKEFRNPAVIREEAARVFSTIENFLSKKESQAVLLRFRDQADNDAAAKTMKVSKATFLRYVSVGVKKIRAIVRSNQADD